MYGSYISFSGKVQIFMKHAFQDITNQQMALFPPATFNDFFSNTKKWVENLSQTEFQLQHCCYD